MVEELDWSVGEVLQALHEAKLDQNTLVIFTSDNGPWLQQGKAGGSAGPLRSGKETVYEGGIRVPFVARWPGKITAGRVVKQPAMATDFNQRSWIMSYSKHGRLPGNEEMENPAAGYLWDLCRRNGVSFKNYGEGAQRVPSANRGKWVGRDMEKVKFWIADLEKAAVSPPEMRIAPANFRWMWLGLPPGSNRTLPSSVAR